MLVLEKTPKINTRKTRKNEKSLRTLKRIRNTSLIHNYAGEQSVIDERDGRRHERKADIDKA